MKVSLHLFIKLQQIISTLFWRSSLMLRKWLISIASSGLFEAWNKELLECFGVNLIFISITLFYATSSFNDAKHALKHFSDNSLEHVSGRYRGWIDLKHNPKVVWMFPRLFICHWCESLNTKSGLILQFLICLMKSALIILIINYFILLI